MQTETRHILLSDRSSATEATASALYDMMASPTIQRSPVSDPSLSNAHISTLLSKSSSSSFSKFVRKPKLGSRRKRSGRSLSSSLNLQSHTCSGINNGDPCSNISNSPYYKGLTDQSLAILERAYSSPAPAPPPPPPPTPTHIPSTGSNILSSGYSPYYKGLTDYSLVIDGSWSPVLQNQNQNQSQNHPQSPYYRGLIDYSLALHGRQLPIASLDGSFLGPPAQSHPSSSDNSQLSVNLAQFCVLEEKEVEISEKTIISEEEDGAGLVTEEKPLRERVSESSKVQSVSDEENAEEKTILKEMESMPKGVDDDNDDVGLVMEEKPLRERVSEASMVGSVSEEIAEIKTSLEGEMDLEKEEEKPLRESVSVSDEQTFASSELPLTLPLPGKDGGDVTEEKEKEKLKDRSAEESNVYEYTWATKHQPMTLGDFICNRDKALQLKALVRKGGGCDHFIFEGPPGVGKRSMIRALLREYFGPEKVQVVEEYKDFNLKGEMVDSIQVRLRKSLHHVEVNLSETKGYEEHVIVDLFKETYGKIKNNSLPCSPANCQAIILYEAEKLSTDSLLYIKWLLEKYRGCNKVFFCCSDESKLQPVKPLCITFRLSPPSSEEIIGILEFIGKQEEIKLSRDFVKKIVLKSKNNLRQAIRSLEANCRNRDALNEDQLILTGWEEDILNIAKNVIEEQSPRQLYIIHGKLQTLMIHDVPPDFVYKCLVAELTTLVDDSLRSGFAKLEKEYNKASEIKSETMKQVGHAQNKQGELDERNNEPTKKNSLSYLKVEEFIAKFMNWYKNLLEKCNKHVQLTAGT